MPRLTLCTIARDEASFLPGCLESVREVVDEIVLVDTGSTDATAELARAAGATVVHHRWSDDFAAARNAALEHVEDGYVLVLDADERLTLPRARALRKLARRGRIDGALLPIHDASRLDASPGEVLDGSARLGEPHLVARLFRRTPDLCWEGLVHEHVTAWALAGRKLETVDAPIVHYGAVPELRARLGKATRNLTLLERVCALEPDNAVFRTYLAQELLQAGQPERAAEVAATAWTSLAAAHASGGPAPDPIPLATLRSFLALRADELETARETLERARAWCGGHPNLALLGCVLAERSLIRGSDLEADSRDARHALAALRRTLARPPRLHAAQPLPGATTWAGWTRAGTLHLLLEQPAPALEAFERALELRPDHDEALLGRAEALILTGRAAEALALGERLVGAGTPDGWILAAVATLQLGDRDDLMALLERAQAALATGDLVAPHRRWYLDELWTQLQVAPAADPGVPLG